MAMEPFSSAEMLKCMVKSATYPFSDFFSSVGGVFHATEGFLGAVDLLGEVIDCLEGCSFVSLELVTIQVEID